MPDLQCNLCGDKLKKRPEFMKHRKIHHSEQVSSCRHASYRACMFGKDNCWFVQDDRSNNQVDENDRNLNEKFFEKVLNMMEKMSESILQMENTK